MDQKRLPLWEKAKLYDTEERIWLHVPGHGGGPGLPTPVALSFAGTARYDLTELPGLDDLFSPHGAIAEAQKLAASAWQSDQSRFLVNGSSSGVLAMVLACCRPGDVILAPRNAHTSFYHAVILSGATPLYLPVEEKDGISLNVTVDAVREALENNPGIRAVFVTSPSYCGVCADLARIAKLVRKHHALLLVDEAHGAHLGFFSGLPPSAAAYADLRVQSWHKTLGALTPGAVLHQRGTRVDNARLADALQWVQTSSPSYPVLLALDAVRQQMALGGAAIVRSLSEHALELRSRLRTVIPLLEETEVADAGFALDRTKVTLLTARAGICGLLAAKTLAASGIDIEYAQPGYLLALVGPGYRQESGEKVADVLKGIGDTEPGPVELPPLPPPEVVMTPREAYYGQAFAINAGEAIGRVSAGMVTGYPPGIPILVPGERITKEISAYLALARGAGVHFRGLDPAGRIRALCCGVK